MTLALFLKGLREDVAAADASAGAFTVWSLRTRHRVFGSDAQEPDFSEFATDGFAIVLDGVVADIGDAAPEEVAVAAAGVLQDWIIGRHNLGWPEIYRSGAFVGLLEPQVSHGAPWWTLHDELCAFGDLERTYGDFIRSLES